VSHSARSLVSPCCLESNLESRVSERISAHQKPALLFFSILEGLLTTAGRPRHSFS
jgi:hypothetical protein